jgi:hypothetical protein
MRIEGGGFMIWQPVARKSDVRRSGLWIDDMIDVSVEFLFIEVGQAAAADGGPVIHAGVVVHGIIAGLVSPGSRAGGGVGRGGASNEEK